MQGGIGGKGAWDSPDHHLHAPFPPCTLRTLAPLHPCTLFPIVIKPTQSDWGMAAVVAGGERTASSEIAGGQRASEPVRPVGIIGGSGLYEFIGELAGKRKDMVHTPYGVVECSTGRWADLMVVFIPRHGPDHDFPPHKVKFKANIWALKEQGVRQVVGTCAVGTLNEKLKPGTITVPDQLIDLTKETRSFFNGRKEGVKHVDMSEPFCPALREVARDTAMETGLEVRIGGTYICFSGPAFETAAEIRMARMMGADLVGMTLAPEAKLCREMGICYLPLCMPVNWAAGMTKEMLTHRQTLEGVSLMKGDLVKLLRYSVERFPRERDCPCARALLA